MDQVTYVSEAHGWLKAGDYTPLGKIERLDFDGRSNYVIIDGKRYAPSETWVTRWEVYRPKAGKWSNIDDFTKTMNDTQVKQDESVVADLWDKRKYYVKLILDELWVKDIDELPKDIQEEVVKVSNMRSVDKITKAIDWLKKKINNKDLQPLYEEARKYKSAEEFYKDKWISKLQQWNYNKYLSESEYKWWPTVKEFIDTIDDFSKAKVVKETHNWKEWYKIVKPDLEFPLNSNRVETLSTNKYVKEYFDYQKQIREEANNK